jgi:hypothetical protein
MKSPIVLALVAILTFAAFSASAAERECRPSLSNMYHCPDKSAPASKGTETSQPTSPAPPRRRVAPAPYERQTYANQYATETSARSHCLNETVVWANNRSHIYHFRGTAYYGATKSGGYMCESDAISAGIRAAKNEPHP